MLDRLRISTAWRMALATFSRSHVLPSRSAKREVGPFIFDAFHLLPAAPIDRSVPSLILDVLRHPLERKLTGFCRSYRDGLLARRRSRKPTL